MDYGINKGQNKLMFICSHCGQLTSTTHDKAYWSETASGSYKLCKCETCGNVNMLDYIEDPNLDVNNDYRYY